MSHRLLPLSWEKPQNHFAISCQNHRYDARDMSHLDAFSSWRSRRATSSVRGKFCYHQVFWEENRHGGGRSSAVRLQPKHPSVMMSSAEQRPALPSVSAHRCVQNLKPRFLVVVHRGLQWIAAPKLVILMGKIRINHDFGGVNVVFWVEQILLERSSPHMLN